MRREIKGPEWAEFKPAMARGGGGVVGILNNYIRSLSGMETEIKGS